MVSAPAIAALLVAATSVPPLADDAPPGCDLLVRIEVGRLADDIRDGWDNLRAFGQFEPRLLSILDGASKRWTEISQRLIDATHSDLSGKSTIITFAIDLDVSGNPIFSAVIRGAAPVETKDNGESKPVNEIESYLVDEHEAFRQGELHWARVDDALLIGDARGLQRQLRRALGKADGPEALVRAAKRVRAQGPVIAAFALSPLVRRQLARAWGDIGVMVKEAKAGNVRVTEKRLTIQLEAGSKEERELVAHGMRAAVATVAGAEKLMLAGAEMVLGLTAAGNKSKMFPREEDALGLSWARESWLDLPVMSARVFERRDNIVEVDAKIARVEGLVAVLSVLLARSGLSPFGSDEVRDEAQALLLHLRERQMQHREINGAFVECGPMPRQIPTRPVPWPGGSCFERLAFAPKGPVRVQVQATVQEGRLLVIARADPDGDGVPRVWYLDETTDEIRGFAGDGEP